MKSANRAMLRTTTRPHLVSQAAPTARYNSTKTPCTAYTQVTHPDAPAESLPPTSTKHILNTYARPPFIATHGKGPWLYTTSSRKYLDFTAGIAVNALGHGDAEFARVMGEQAAKISHTSNVFHDEWAGKFASLLVGLTKREEANEGAFKFVRKIVKERWAESTGKPWDQSPKTRFVCFENAFHGRSMGALSATFNPKYQKPFEPLVPGFDLGVLNDPAALDLVTDLTCAVIVEPIQGEGGLD
ncbi:acetylornithine aminotransferase, partial [Tulasnella sp. 403]